MGADVSSLIFTDTCELTGTFDDDIRAGRSKSRGCGEDAFPGTEQYSDSWHLDQHLLSSSASVFRDEDPMPLFPWTDEATGGVGTACEQEWRRRLLAGASVSLDQEPVSLWLDREIGCLEVREHEAMYPLAELHECSELPHEGVEGAAFELELGFADFDAVLLQFDEEDDRAGFAAALQRLAAEAREAGPANDLDSRLALDEDDVLGLGGSNLTVPLQHPFIGLETARAVATEGRLCARKSHTPGGDRRAARGARLAYEQAVNGDATEGFSICHEADQVISAARATNAKVMPRTPSSTADAAAVGASPRAAASRNRVSPTIAARAPAGGAAEVSAGSPASSARSPTAGGGATAAPGNMAATLLVSSGLAPPPCTAVSSDETGAVPLGGSMPPTQAPPSALVVNAAGALPSPPTVVRNSTTSDEVAVPYDLALPARTALGGDDALPTLADCTPAMPAQDPAGAVAAEDVGAASPARAAATGALISDEADALLSSPVAQMDPAAAGGTASISIPAAATPIRIEAPMEMGDADAAAAALDNEVAGLLGIDSRSDLYTETPEVEGALADSLMNGTEDPFDFLSTGTDDGGAAAAVLDAMTSDALIIMEPLATLQPTFSVAAAAPAKAPAELVALPPKSAATAVLRCGVPGMTAAEAPEAKSLLVDLV
eukprot:NODE_2051_length_2305_cov_10.168044.p1 GENE.NODE_2051_length_2305_cov_10.168044~~NODE_2051_length_2305_cov_10.168044.p1  ORF type:complete len:663 (-),score=201.60 NODE_2051_length_2305_cov_10.168044:189-2177(-)